jgi:alkylation response protein AidB-like acyl-CoA dehydrogenase
MNFDLSEEQQDIRRAAREFLAARYKLEEVRRLALEEERGFTDAQWEEIVGLGWPELAVAQEGLGIVELAVVAEELGYALAPTPLQSTWAATLLLDAAGEAERLSGGRRGTVAQWDEDTDGAPDRSTLEPDGSSLSGVKIAVPDAASADLLVVTAAGGRHFVVDPADVAIEPVETLDTTRRLATVRLDGAAGEELSGDAGAFRRAWHAIAVMTAAESVGLGQRAMEMAVEYAKDRTQFERPIGTYQAVSHACAQMLLEVEGARSAVLWAAWALDHEPETAARAANVAKAYASDCGARVTASALQVHGGIGFTWEHDLHFFLKRAQANAHAYGDARWHRDELAAALFD